MSDARPFSRGVFYSQKSEKNYSLTRVKPSHRLSCLVETFWMVSWDLHNKPSHQQQNIPDPCIHIVFETRNSRIIGAVTKRYSVELVGKGLIFGIKFHPGGFYSLGKETVSTLTDASISIKAYFGEQSNDWVKHINAASDIESKVQLAEDFLVPRIPNSVENVEMLTQMLKRINNDAAILKVGDLADRYGLSERSLQRLFKHQVGVSPKWVIRKYRIQEVLSRLEQGDHEWKNLISGLDYFDQSHFIRDFKNLVGVTPTEYIKRLA